MLKFGGFANKDNCALFSWIGAAAICFGLFLVMSSSILAEPGFEIGILIFLFFLLAFALRQLCEGSGMFKDTEIEGDAFQTPLPWMMLPADRKRYLREQRAKRRAGGTAAAPAAAPAPVRSAPAVSAAPAPAPTAPEPEPEAPSDEDKPDLLTGARGGQADDLKQIKGVGPKLEGLLHKLGVFHFDQVASWNAKEVAWVDYHLEGFKGRVSRDDWVAQAKLLAAGEKTEFAERVARGEVASSQTDPDA